MDFRQKPLWIMEKDAGAVFKAGLAAVDAETSIDRTCRRNDDRLIIGNDSYDLSSYNKVFVIGAGKAVAPMGAAMERLLGDRLTGGLLVVKYGHTRPLIRLKTIEAGHPLPDEKGEEGALEILKIARQATAEDLIICLLSGGGSALLPLPAPGISLKDKQETMSLLLACGASIAEINALRKHLSAIKGGQLARAAHPAALITLMISDVVGNDPAVIASGPTVPDPSTYADCRRILEKYRLHSSLPEVVTRHLASGWDGQKDETPKSDDPVFLKTRALICADNRAALLAAQGQARRLGYETMILSSSIEGETRDVARMHVAIAREILTSGNPVSPPACLLSGGETTVTLRGSGRGGRNQEFCLAAAGDISDTKRILIFSAGTDGSDGPTEAAGAVMHFDLLKKADALGLSPRAYLENNDAYTFFSKTDGLILTGPTGTNVMDLRIILIG